MELYIENIEFDQLKKVGGNLYFYVNNRYFPEENWYDAVDMDLAYWLPQLISFARNHSDFCLFSFMDGPCAVKLKRLSDGTVLATCLWDMKAEILDTVIDFPVFLKNVVKALRRYQRELYEKGIPFPFVEQLSQLTQVNRQLENVT